MPPRGGWAIELDGRDYAAFSEGELVEKIARFRRNNGGDTNETNIRRTIWNVFCHREPQRCSDRRNPANEVAIAAAPVVQRDLKPEVMGPWIWQFLNLAAVRWNPGSSLWFNSTLDMVTVLLECPICREEWRTVLHDNPPAGFQTPRDVCIWLNNAHNAVNIRIGKAIYPYYRMVSEYGAPPL